MAPRWTRSGAHWEALHRRLENQDHQLDRLEKKLDEALSHVASMSIRSAGQYPPINNQGKGKR